jgi:hypothetical protein
MLGLLALGLTCFMIYNLVKNALVGTQLSKEDQFNGTIEMIIPLGTNSDFHLDVWQNSLSSFKIPSSFLKIHILIDGVHPSLASWQSLQSKIPYLEIHHFPMRPTNVEATPWMLDQISSKIQGQIVIIGDAELVPSERAFISIAKKVTDKNQSYFVVPQTAKTNVLGEALAVINPTLAFASFFGFHKWGRNLTHSLLSISQGWMCMDLKTFKQLDFKLVRVSNWKEAISRQWELQGKNFHLAFGEKLLLRYYPEELKVLIQQMHEKWSDLWGQKSRKGFWLFFTAILLWSFPVICFFTHPFWSIASFFLLVMYRFFSKIVFQESWKAIALHPVACFVWLGTFFWWVIGNLKSQYGSQASSRT